MGEAIAVEDAVVNGQGVRDGVAMKGNLHALLDEGGGGWGDAESEASTR